VLQDCTTHLKLPGSLFQLLLLSMSQGEDELLVSLVSWMFGMRPRFGRGQPMLLTLSFGKLPWFDDQGEIQPCHWLKRTHSLEIHAGHIQKNELPNQSQRCISFRTSNHGISPNDSG
jgi:hypothetical protein